MLAAIPTPRYLCDDPCLRFTLGIFTLVFDMGIFSYTILFHNQNCTGTVSRMFSGEVTMSVSLDML